MTIRTLVVLASLVAAPAVAQTVPAPARDQAKLKEGTGTIRGRVFGVDANTPLRRARVALTAPELQIQKTYTTDAEGRFEFKRLPASRYNLAATKPGFIMMSYGQRRPFERGRPVELGDGQVLEQVNFTLPRASAISGRVVDDLGEPIGEVQVAAFRLHYWEGRRRPVPVGRVSTTNDTGYYRLYGLPPGDYYVGTTISPGMTAGFGGEAEDGFVYAPTYYPATPSLNEATRVALKLAQERPNVDITLVSSRTASISGMAFTSQGLPAAGGSVGLGQRVTGPSQNSWYGRGGTSVQADGTFKITGVAPGEYEVSLDLTNRETNERESVNTTVVVSGADVTGVSLAIAPSSRISGTLATDKGQPAPFAASAVRVNLPNAGYVQRSYASAPVRDDWTFQVKGVDGPRYFRVSGLPAGWALKSVLHDGREITDEPFEFKGSEDVGGFQLVLSDQFTTVSGDVTDDRGRAVKDYALVVFAQDSGRWTANSRFVTNARPDQNGKFKVEKLPSGDYLAAALEYLDEGDASDPEFMEGLRGSATRFSLTDGETKTLNLKLVKSER